MSNTDAVRRTERRFLTAALGLAIALVAIIGPAKAEAAPLTGESTTLALKKGVAKALDGAGVAVKPLKPASAGKKGISFPVSGGDLDPATLRGKIEHSGGLRLAAGGDRLDLEKFTIKLGKRATLSARVGGDRVTILNLDLAKAKVGREGLAYRVSKVKAALTGVAAAAINGTFGGKVVAPGLVIGKARVVALTDEVSVLAEGDTQLTLDPGAASLLAGAGISAAPVAPASATPAGALAFPITGGKLATGNPGGTIEHSGGIRLSDSHGGPTIVDLLSFTINLDAAPDLTALVGSSRVSILTLDLSGASIAVGKSNGRVTVSGVKARLTADAAGALNSAFGTSAFAEGQLLGTTVTHAATG